ncbi:hypothetical protein [Parasegetibacter sp. NRK P23]|uniref:hypothetical protein n=1 Tax=Parasegetibacter sp. NRK P23 TaxID=2942999 RepID=UPI002042EEFA|nr:hypothetical protein [Parasegetibacter sp. NRK P23]MCM5529894.1 hypothetical protein [Parasegetibacter sp. NRK P23]
MTRFFLLACTVIFFSCGGGNKFRASNTEDKELFKAINALVKDPANKNARNDLAYLYADSRQRHLNNIEQLNASTYDTKWDGLVQEYTSLQNIYFAINSSLAMTQLVKPVNFATELNETKENAAEFYYRKGEEMMRVGNRAALKESWNLFRRSQQYIPEYKDSKAKIQEALELGTVDVVITDMTFNDFPVWNFGVPLNNNLERQLVQDLGGNYGNNNGARYFTETDARNSTINPSIVVESGWRNLFFNMSPAISSYDVDRSKTVKQKNPTTKKDEDITVTAKLKITKRIFTARGDLELNIRDIAAQKNISWNTIPASTDYIIETATFTGDSRALTEQDAILVSRRYVLPNRYMLLSELYRSIYSQVRNTIQRNTAW